MLDITFVKDFIDEIIEIEKINREDLYNNGAVHYMNGNDGTDFDLQYNGHACEFYVYWKNKQGAIKVYVEKDGLKAYCYYDKNDAFNPNKIHKHQRIRKLALVVICEYLYGTFDKKDIWDAEITNWQLTESCGIPMDEGEDEEW